MESKGSEKGGGLTSERTVVLTHPSHVLIQSPREYSHKEGEEGEADQLSWVLFGALATHLTTEGSHDGLGWRGGQRKRNINFIQQLQSIN